MQHYEMGRGDTPPDDTITVPHMLELIGVSHSCPYSVSHSSCWSGHSPPSSILKDISFEAHSGEIMAILGSQGSGKKTLLEVISHRTTRPGSTRGQILLNDVPLTLRLFQEQCGYVSKRCQLIEGLSVRQTLQYMARMTLRRPIPRRVSDGSYMSIRVRVKQVLADLALSSLASYDVSQLGPAERRRLAIGLQIIRDPLLLILDDPCAGLCPLDTYFIVSMLSNHVKKYQRIVLFTLERPRSDIFPFLDRVTFLCLGDLVYTGSTRMMMEYFSSIGFPCPDLENPLMYYLCLSTVDRRTHERIVESSAQIAALVDKFKLEGQEYRKLAAPLPKLNAPLSIPLTAYGGASTCSILLALTSRQFSANLSFKRMILRLGLLPLCAVLLYSFILPSLGDTQNSFQSRSYIIFSLLAAITFLVPALTANHFYQHRNRFYEDSSRLSLYRGPALIVTSIIANLPFTLIAVWLTASITYWTTPLRLDENRLERWSIFAATLWGVATFVEQVTVAIMCFVRSNFTAALSTSYFLTPLLVMGSATVRSMIAAPTLLYYLNWLNIYYWASWTMHFGEFQFNVDLVRVPHVSHNGTVELCAGNTVPGRCIFLSGNHYLDQRLLDVKDIPEWSLVFWKNFAFTAIFAISSWLINTVIYVIPLPASLKAKFRD